MLWEVKDSNVVREYLARYENKLGEEIIRLFEAHSSEALEWIKTRYNYQADSIGYVIWELTNNKGTETGKILTEMVISIDSLWKDFLEKVRPEVLGWI